MTKTELEQIKVELTIVTKQEENIRKKFELVATKCEEIGNKIANCINDKQIICFHCSSDLVELEKLQDYFKGLNGIATVIVTKKHNLEKAIAEEELVEEDKKDLN